MTSNGQCRASASATAVFPTAVGPTMIGRLAPAKPALQLLTGELHDRGPAVHVVRRKIGLEQPEEKLPHLGLAQRLSCFDRRPAGERGREPLQPVGPAAEPSPCEVGDGLPEAGAAIEAWVWSGHCMERDRSSAKGLHLEPYSPDLLLIGLERVQLLVGEL